MCGTRLSAHGPSKRPFPVHMLAGKERVELQQHLLAAISQYVWLWTETGATELQIDLAGSPQPRRIPVRFAGLRCMCALTCDSRPEAPTCTLVSTTGTLYHASTGATLKSSTEAF